MTFSSSFTNNIRLTGCLHPSENNDKRERSLHHIIQQAGEAANLPFPAHPYMLRRTGLYYRATLLLQPLGLTLRQCCLLWNWHGTTAEFSPQEEQDYRAIDRTTKAAFKAALEKLKALSLPKCYRLSPGRILVIPSPSRYSPGLLASPQKLAYLDFAEKIQELY